MRLYKWLATAGLGFVLALGAASPTKAAFVSLANPSVDLSNPVVQGSTVTFDVIYNGEGVGNLLSLQFNIGVSDATLVSDVSGAQALSFTLPGFTDQGNSILYGGVAFAPVPAPGNTVVGTLSVTIAASAPSGSILDIVAGALEASNDGVNVLPDNSAPVLASITIPEPGVLALLGVGLAGLGFLRRSRA